jgi:hypothetical protein
MVPEPQVNDVIIEIIAGLFTCRFIIADLRTGGSDCNISDAVEKELYSCGIVFIQYGIVGDV